MKKVTLIALSITALLATDCSDWYKKMRQKYHIVGTKTGIVMDKQGNWQKLFAKGTASVDFADEDEYEDAIMEAEMKAKANIAHFLKENITSDRFLDTVSKKLKEMHSNGQTQTKKIDKKTLKTKAQRIHNSASSLLKGVITLCESVNANKKQAIVIVGVSPKTQRAADSARHSMYKDHTTGGSLEGGLPLQTTPTQIQNRLDASDSLDF